MINLTLPNLKLVLWKMPSKNQKASYRLGENILMHMPDEGLVSSMNFLNLNNNKEATQLKIGQKIWTGILQK